MMNAKIRWGAAGTLCLALCAVLFCPVPSHAFPARLVPLQRDDGFTRGILVTGSDGAQVMIGMTDTPFDDRLFLVQRGGGEAIFQVRENGDVDLISGQQIDLRYILCLVDAVLAMVDDGKACEEGNNICYIRALIGFVIKVLNCSEPATTL